MALDEADHRLFVGIREPARLAIFDTTSSRMIAALPSAEDADVTANNLPAAQFNAVQQTRYLPGTFMGNITGAAPSLHLPAGPGNGSPKQNSPQTVLFTKTNVGGTTTVSTSAHIDSALSDAAHPIGAAIHGTVDVNGAATRNSCP